MRRAERDAGLRHPLAPGLLDGERDAEIGDQRSAVVQQDVFGLDVAMDHAALVGVRERIGDVGSDAHRVGNRQLVFALQTSAQRLPFNERHDVEEQSVG